MAEIGANKTAKFMVLELKQNISTPANATPPPISNSTTTKKHPEKHQNSSPPTKIASAPPAMTSSSSSSSTIDVESLILQTLAKDDVISDTWEFALKFSLDHQVVVGHVKSLLVDYYVKDEAKSTTLWLLSEEGESILHSGSPEFQVFAAIPSSGATMETLSQALGENVVKIGLGPCMKNKWVKKDKNLIVRLTDDVRDDTAELLRLLSSGIELSEDDLKNLKKRKLVTQQVRKSYRIEKGVEYSERRQKRCADITREMLGNIDEMEPGTHWSERKFKPMNFSAMGAPIGGGSLHPLLKVRAEFRRILMEMGFQEMPTNKWVESSFWNFDALFQPQSHPARDAHDTFYMKDPRDARSVPEDYYEVVKRTHEVGGFGSIGYGCNFKKEETMKNILRTHTTAISAQMLYKLANQEGGFTPQKYFSIDRVFRNEAMDATHLCEFHQVEGLVADYNLNLGNLIATIKTFFEKIGITQLRFKPAYNPYTEPSMEIFGYHPELKKWTEIGNSGMFRPEMLRPMGLPEGVRVIAWGLSLERPTMIKYRIENIRDLFGHKADLISQRNAPMALF